MSGPHPAQLPDRRRAAPARRPAPRRRARSPRPRSAALRDAVRGRVFTPGDSGYNGARVVFNRRWDGVAHPPSCACATAPTSAPSCAGPTATTSRSSRAPAATATTATRPATARSSSTCKPQRHPLSRRDRDDRPGRAHAGDLHRARPPRRDDPRRLVPDGGARRARARRRDGARRTRLRPHARPRHELRRRHRRRPPPASRRRTTTCSGRCAAAAGASRSSPRSACAPAASTAPRSSASPTRAPRARRRSPTGTPSRPRAPARPDRDPHARRATARAPSASTSAPNSDSGRLIAPLGGSPTTGSAPYLTVQRRWAGRGDLAAQPLRRLLALRRPSGSPPTAAARSSPPPTPARLILDAYGGAINRPRRADTAFPHRDERFSVQVLSYTHPDARDPREARPQADRPLRQRRLRQLRRPRPRHALRAYYGANLPRLRRIKRRARPGEPLPTRAGDQVTVIGVPTCISLSSLRMSALRHAHAAVRDLARDQPRLVGPVDADDPAARPVGERGGGRAGDERQRPVDRVLVARELRADVELPLRRRPLRLPDADRRAEDLLALLDQRRLDRSWWRSSARCRRAAGRSAPPPAPSRSCRWAGSAAAPSATPARLRRSCGRAPARGRRCPHRSWW